MKLSWSFGDGCKNVSPGTVALKCKSQRQIGKHNSISENTTFSDLPLCFALQGHRTWWSDARIFNNMANYYKIIDSKQVEQLLFSRLQPKNID